VDVWVAILPVNGPILGVSGVSADQTPGCLVARMGHRLGDDVSTHEAWWAVRDSNPRPPARHAVLPDAPTSVFVDTCRSERLRGTRW